MVTGLLDTSIVVDFLRTFPPARDWLEQQAELGVTQFVWLEIIEGARDKSHQSQALRLLRRFELIELTAEDIQWSVEQLLAYRLSHNIGAFDV